MWVSHKEYHTFDIERLIQQAHNKSTLQPHKKPENVYVSHNEYHTLDIENLIKQTYKFLTNPPSNPMENQKV